MTLKSTLARITAKSSYWLLHDVLHRGGTSLPGKLAVSIDPNILTKIQQDFELIIVTGTNGKTLTTALITRVLQAGGYTVITNPSGSNMIQGITGTLVTAKVKPSPNGQKPVAVLEVDEANVEKIAAAIKPKMFVLTNIFRDQLDRYGEIYTTYDKIIAGIKHAPEAIVLANGDSPIFTRGDFTNERKYFGFNHIQPADYNPTVAPINTDGILSPTDHSVLNYDFITYANLGKYFSTTDSFVRPKLNYQVTSITDLTPKYSTFSIDNTPLRIEIGGLYNIYNALTAFAVGREFNVDPEKIKTAFESNAQIFGRQEALHVDGKDVIIVLIKNPVGTNSVIDMMVTEKDDFSLLALLNANYADGIDTSWIWDAEFEKLHDTNIKAVATGGERYKDLRVRLKMAGFPDQAVYEDLTQIVTAIKSLPTDKVYIAATYTAMLQLREQLGAAGYIKGGF
ncbi:Mur ligase family protein [Leuconostoc gasicomitatum]|uniref:Lipid II isoglutaminyl synthase (glutamine-hydrolyzing) subunit MurT n=1 Tax=Leuconostoc gasicomitatum TaxID=115778 RepID=A0A9Q3SU20_9LACO|nr:Mur ligase family protein [Leuconostoc gasicomitatum]MBR2276655.1 Mur ligase family protein [Leuconostoc sp.]MBZ5944012.1 Mur ligase family protein [Leuconostoc gasicomitatum]MBZ5945670.1 Mur ligase family protein [Leuconostoc gasicomitatum]MBZ5949167.1 Mur ligase family protein [Leuconostoc gasicomitatum]MBZ5951293.1 Mur ligase family protein [Leuconostoc gasicomitatum]